MRLSSAMIILMLIVSLPVFPEAQRLVKVGSDDHYPVMFQDTNGEAKGLYVDLLTEIGLKENISFEYLFGSWDAVLEKIKSGEIDLLPGVAYSEERSQYMDYCQNPLLTVWGEIYVLKASDINTIFQISGKKIGVIKGDINTKSFQDLITKFEITCQFVELTGYDAVFKAVADKTVDAGIAGITFGAPKMGEYGLRATGIAFNPYNLYFSTTKNKNMDLLKIIDTHLALWMHQETSVFSQAKDKWLYGSVGTITVLPPWLINSLIILSVVLLSSFVFIILLRMRIKQATARILHSEKNFREMVETIPLAIHLTSGIEQVSEYINPTMVSLFGYTLKDIPSVAQWWPLAYPDEEYRRHIAGEWTRRVQRAIDTQSSIEPMEVVVACKDGSKKNISWGYTTLGDKNYSFGLDLTERKLAESNIKSLLEEKELLLKEVHHRIKNNMNTIKGLLDLQISEEENSAAVESLKDAESRVQSIIMLYDRLYCTDNYRELSVKSYLEPLTQEVVNSFSQRGRITIHTEIVDFILNIQLLSPIGIITNELLTNMMKHAFTGRESGCITVSASITGNQVRLVLQDDGVGIPESVNFEDSRGLGMHLVRMLTEQIGGSIRIERDGGTRFILEFEK